MIVAMTMVRNDRFLKKWVDYYGSQLGRSNLFVFFDGEDQQVPDFCDGVNISIIPKMKGNVAQTDRLRSRFMSKQAAQLFAKGAEMVIATDADEFLIVDPALNISLPDFLRSLPDRPTHSGLGVDVLQNLKTEAPVDFSRPFLQQRSRGWFHARYSKPSVITRPLTWGGGYHRVKGRNFHIEKDLYLFHFGGVDQEALRDISNDISRSENGWNRHQLKRLRALENLSNIPEKDWDKSVKFVRMMQTVCRPVFALNKPSTFTLKFVGKIPERFKNII
ncbi:MAG: glycosyltransferase family 2 protein [Muribaculaceae bacterium]|nr:glycosyltransferase family 2 protein [Muribaculaceae bacterium]